MSDDTATTTSVLAVTPSASAFVRAAQPEPDEAGPLALYVEVSGASDGVFTYDIYFAAAADAAARDAREERDGLTVIIPAQSIEALRGATLDLGEDRGEASLVLVNPNTPPKAPSSVLETGDLSGPLAAQVLAVLEREVNPQIAAHGGRADLIGVDDAGIAYLRLSGGCQGCGMAQVTLSQGIAVAIKDAVPEITDIVDVTAHEAGESPYFEAAKK